ncbi:glucose-6-phosphate isomerase [Candidatus Riesia sp. GBBU]|nr:glucose-6-phosphate isomerase [Candidatus Riesia sp. GBBU]ARC55084.1 glucose-6-phosphate isomerase [Candidatus Riesia sp. GBBU]
MKNINPTKTFFWKKLQHHYNRVRKVKIQDLFKEDKSRFLKFSKNFRDIIWIDYSKNKILEETMKNLFNLSKEMDVKSAINSMFNGEKINKTENRAVLHTAIRNRNKNKIILDGIKIKEEVRKIFKKIENFSEDVIAGNWRGYSGKRITDIVNIGIGGSDLGPRMVLKSLKSYRNHLKIHFVYSSDGIHIFETLKKISHETTLFLISSKTFSTHETISNSEIAKNWFISKSKNIKHMQLHFFAISMNYKKSIEFGIEKKNIFKIFDWIGGRYSLWSSVGLSIALSIGFKNFENLLDGAYAMDNHFLNTTESDNIPIILALISIWYNNFFRSETEVILPYSQRLSLLPTYLQQCLMESNGKSVDRLGNFIKYQTCPIIWGETGTNFQHSFCQLMHQGKKLIPCDFIGVIQNPGFSEKCHEETMSNFFSQTRALAFGNFSKKSTKNSNLYKVLFGNRPSNSILLKKIDPYTIGALISMYEHKTFVQGVIWNIYSFDQWGVELGKKLSFQILSDIRNNKEIDNYDDSTNNIINLYKKFKK